jgi:hypothetical protein
MASARQGAIRRAGNDCMRTVQTAPRLEQAMCACPLCAGAVASSLCDQGRTYDFFANNERLKITLVTPTARQTKMLACCTPCPPPPPRLPIVQSFHPSRAQNLVADHPLSVGLHLLAHEGSPDRKSRKCAECLTPSSIASVLRLSIS